MERSQARGQVLITGGSMGIGRACAQRLAADGWQVMIAARGESAIEETLAALPGEGHEGVRMDVSEADQWSAADLRSVGALVHAAAVIGPVGTVDQIDPAEFLEVLRINVLGTFLAVRACLPALRESSGRIVAFSGGGATGPLQRFDAYAASKAATARLVENLSDQGIAINAVAPGFVATRMHDVTLAAGPERAGREYFERTQRDLEQGGTSPELAAELVEFLLSPQAKGISGKLISAPWDPWREEEFQEKLRRDESFATIRRIDDQFFTAAGAR
jgi:NAD(P)-dependent dehydrogenase (short-subunit alcohol dehydrogenase family)